MIRPIAFLIVCFPLFLGPICIASNDDDEGGAVEKQMEKVVALGPGIHKIQKDKKGHIFSCVVVGQSRISTALGKAKGLEMARDNANLVCSAEFVKWL
jgi:hypothetical protein